MKMQFLKRIAIPFSLGMVVLIALNKYWVKSENYLLSSLFAGLFSIVLVLILNRLIKKNQDPNR